MKIQTMYPLNAEELKSLEEKYCSESRYKKQIERLQEDVTFLMNKVAELQRIQVSLLERMNAMEQGTVTVQSSEPPSAKESTDEAAMKEEVNPSYVVENSEAENWYQMGKQHFTGKTSDGKSVPKDYREAVKCYQNAVNLGHANACYELGECFYWGYGMDSIDKEQGNNYLKLAAEKGSAKAQFELAQCYYYGFRKYKKNIPEAIRLYHEAARNGDAEAQYELGECYYYGWGLDTDYGQAALWYQKSMNQGFKKAERAVRKAQKALKK